MHENHYVYAYMRNDGTPYYIGRGTNRRAWVSHKAVKTPKDKSKIVILESNLTIAQSVELERKMIEQYGKAKDGGYLANIKDNITGLGFYGKKHTDEVIEKIKNKGGRPRMFTNNAEKQKAYRKKKKELNATLA